MKTKFLQIILLTITVLVILLGFLNCAFAQLEWSLPVSGEVNNSFNLTRDQISALPPTIVQADIYCCGVFVTGGNWLGPKLSQILELAELSSQAESVDFTATDGYQVTIPLTTAMREDVIVAYQLNGEFLDEGLRLIIPGANGDVWIAGINQIIVTAVPSDNPTPASILPNFNAPISSPAPTSTSGSTPTPSPTTSPSPTPTPTSTPSPSPSPTPTSPPTTGTPPEIYYAVAAVAGIATTGAVLIKKHNK